MSGILGWVPGSGRQTLGVCIFTYAGTVRVGFISDAAVIPDPSDSSRPSRTRWSTSSTWGGPFGAVEARAVPTDNARQDIDVAADLDTVLATIRDVGSQPEWIPTIKEAEVAEAEASGLPRTARFLPPPPWGPTGTHSPTSTRRTA